MRMTMILGLLAGFLAVGFASAGANFGENRSDRDDFCFGYAICE